ncbi:MULTISPECIES: twin-arginine translocase TatA/TatE family subunit [Desulfitobacterium]|uniref:Sec-independent protein translocase protein TatA n=2 Tax=Desulfitobacterium dehalogenans TaxID=36854 RepID=I4A8Z0_DESDJ|nr:MULTISPECIES: twin-arginine translocase TatA/TatE family subunit [Desulfitobacterium]AFM00425.1 twin arginine-targeting protein translocase, TatA/E family [Desulfitobacterium dehalogenans ATCC 51507]HHY26588.1 twin-arginine translocase TatA/TatE family subunit [Desulfitobacterium dehalogenans]
MITFGMITPMVAVIVLIIALLIFGPGKLPEVGKAMSKGVKNFKREMNTVDAEIVSEEKNTDEKEKKEE